MPSRQWQAATDITSNYHGGDVYSVEAHEDTTRRKAHDRARIVAYVKAQPNGATCDEIERALLMPHQTASARVSELRAKGELTSRHGDKRRTRTGSYARVHYASTEEAIA